MVCGVRVDVDPLAVFSAHTILRKSELTHHIRQAATDLATLTVAFNF